MISSPRSRTAPVHSHARRHLLLVALVLTWAIRFSSAVDMSSAPDR